MIDIDLIWQRGGFPVIALMAIAAWMMALIGREFTRLCLGQSLVSRLPVLGALVAIAPLIGLLGTVVGLVEVFSADAAADTIAQGISRALLSTQLGLIIAVPGMFMRQVLLRWQERLPLSSSAAPGNNQQEAV